MKPRSRELLDRAIAAMVAAIDIYNKPDFRYRAESFTILALNAWELLLKAKWLAINKNRLSRLYVREGKGSKRPRYKRTRSGNPLTHSIDYLANKLTEHKVIDKACRKNLEALTELRNTTVHFYHPSPKLGERVQEIGMAAVKNFASAARDWFNENLSHFNFYLMPLSFVAPPPVTKAVELNPEENRFLSYIKGLENVDADPNAPYSVAINVEVRFVSSKSSAAAPVHFTTDQNAPKVQLSEEQIRERYPWDYKELTKQCRECYSDFKVDQKYHRLRKDFESNMCFAHERRLDPKNPRPKKMFYAPDILKQFDNQYRRRQ